MNEHAERTITINGKVYEVVEIDSAIKMLLAAAVLGLAAALGTGVLGWV